MPVLTVCVGNWNKKKKSTLINQQKVAKNALI